MNQELLDLIKKQSKIDWKKPVTPEQMEELFIKCYEDLMDLFSMEFGIYVKVINRAPKIQVEVAPPAEKK